jgi:hypothetical protein
MLPRAEEIDLGRAAKAHCFRSSRGSDASNHLRGEPNRHAANRRIGDVIQSLVLIPSSVWCTMLTFAVK